LFKLREYWQSLFDVRPGERSRVAYMGLYLLLVLFAYYILKPVSRGMFLFQLDLDKLPYLYIVIAAAGGVMAYVYTKIAIHVSLKAAVDWCIAFMAGTLLLIWYLLSFNWDWMLYVFNVFVSLFSITLVSQGWMVAANTFTTREAKRVYAVLGIGAVVGAAFGGTFTAEVVKYVSVRNLLLASVALVIAAYFCFLKVARQPGVDLGEARGAEREETFELKDVGNALLRYGHLQIIVAIIALTYIVDVTVEYQFNAYAKAEYSGSQKEMVAFMGRFFGIWLNLVTFIFQAFLTAFVVSRFGVGGALQIMPVSITVASLFAFFTPGVLAAAATRITEAATRYTFNRTGMELLYLPLPSELRNRTKAFTDIFVDRFARGIGGILLIPLTQYFGLSARQLAMIVIVYCAVWILLSIRARNEYVATVRRKLEMRRLDLDSLRISTSDASTIRLLEKTLESAAPRQATYALSLLAEAPGYSVVPKLNQLVQSPSAEMRAKVFELANDLRVDTLHEHATAELRNLRSGDDTSAARPAVQYLIRTATDRTELMQRLLAHPSPLVGRTAMEQIPDYPEVANALITPQWIKDTAASPDPARRTLAAGALHLAVPGTSAVLQQLLSDSDHSVAGAACRAAAARQDRRHLDALLRLLARARTRQAAISALTAFGDRIIGTLGDVLLDRTTQLAVRRQIPRVLRSIGGQRAVDYLLQSLSEPDLTVRSAVLKALNSLRESNPKLTYGRESVTEHILNEARYYYEMSAALQPLRNEQPGQVRTMLVRTLEHRLRSTLERLFRLLGLRYPPREIYAAYLAMNRKDREEHVAALEFLDNVLERELKRIILPLLDPDSRLSDVGSSVFGVQKKDAQSALRELMRSGDSWLVATAIATAAEMGMSDLAPEIEAHSTGSGSEVEAVARAAMASLAAA
jgi:AAA family ATP:ADP antiporter